MPLNRIFLRSLALLLGAALIFGAPLGAALARPAAGPQGDLPGPEGSGAFGSQVVMLANGNFVVTDPLFDAGSTADVGAVYLYDGATLALISALTGSHANDKVGANPPVALTNGNFVVYSPYWDRDGLADAGAATWCSGASGCAGPVSPVNSLVGSRAYDWVGEKGVTALSSGNYIVLSPWWNNGDLIDAGALTWCDGTTGCVGELSPANSRVGASPYDQVSGGEVSELRQGNYVAVLPNWDDGLTIDAGAVTWCADGQPCLGAVSAANSLVGANPSPTRLSNGHYVVANRQGVTWCNGQTGCAGAVDAASSLLTRPEDLASFTSQVSSLTTASVFTLTNGNYVVSVPLWDRPDALDAGAVAWCDGGLGCRGVITDTNSLVGSAALDRVGSSPPYYSSPVYPIPGVSALANGNYVVESLNWNGGLAAITWCDGQTGCIGPVTRANSLTGGNRNDGTGQGGIVPLANGSYVIHSPGWSMGPSYGAGAITWCSGAGGCQGTVSLENSAVGLNSAYWGYGSAVALPLANGNYLLTVPYLDYFEPSDPAAQAPRVVFCPGDSGCRGLLSELGGVTPADGSGLAYLGAHVLANGNYVIRMTFSSGPLSGNYYHWCDGQIGCSGPFDPSDSLKVDTSSGAFQALPNGSYLVRGYTGLGWCSGTGPCGKTGLGLNNSLTQKPGMVYPPGRASSDSRFRSQPLSQNLAIVPLNNGHYLVFSSFWGSYPDWGKGAVTPSDGLGGRTTGVIDAANSLLGQVGTKDINTGATLIADYDEANARLVVGFPRENRAAVFQGLVRTSYQYLPLAVKPSETPIPMPTVTATGAP